MGPKKLALWFLIISVVLSAVLGIIAILTGSFGDLEIRIILTTLTISAASICALASGAVWERGQLRILPAAGIVLALLAALLLVAGIWLEPHSEHFWNFTFSIGVLAAATAHACLMTLARLAQRFSWARLATLAAIYLLAGLIIFTIYVDVWSNLEFRLIVFKLMGTISIIVAALTIVTPIFHRLSRNDLQRPDDTASEVAGGLFPTITCPQCGASQANSMTETTCDNCGCRFVTSILARGSLPVTDH